MIAVLRVFEFDAFLSCVLVSYKKGGWWGGAKLPPKDERSDVMSEMLMLFCCFVDFC